MLLQFCETAYVVEVRSSLQDSGHVGRAGWQAIDVPADLYVGIIFCCHFDLGLFWFRTGNKIACSMSYHSRINEAPNGAWVGRESNRAKIGGRVTPKTLPRSYLGYSIFAESALAGNGSSAYTAFRSVGARNTQAPRGATVDLSRRAVCFSMSTTDMRARGSSRRGTFLDEQMVAARTLPVQFRTCVAAWM